MRRTEDQGFPLIAVVGPCGAGKSLLVRALHDRGYNAREVLQEHSYVPTMWQRITQPDLLVYLDVSADVARRRKSIQAPDEWWEELDRRLQHSRQHADLYLHTDDLTAQEILRQVIVFLTEGGAQ